MNYGISPSPKAVPMVMDYGSFPLLDAIGYRCVRRFRGMSVAMYGKGIGMDKDIGIDKGIYMGAGLCISMGGRNTTPKAGAAVLHPRRGQKYYTHRVAKTLEPKWP